MNRRWICNDVWMDIFPHFDRPELGLKMALISPRFDALVDQHFDGKNELTLWRAIKMHNDTTVPKANDIGPTSKLSVWIDDKFVGFPLPDHPLANKIRFKDIRIHYIDDSVVTFLRSNKHILDRSGTQLELSIANEQPIWDVWAREIWPIFAPNIRRLGLFNGDHLDNLRRLISPTILTDLNQLNSIYSAGLCPDVIDHFDGPNESGGQMLSKWLHTSRTDGQPKRLSCFGFKECPENGKWVNNFKEIFLCARTSVSYKICFQFYVSTTTPTIEPFELVNERTNEKLILMKDGQIFWLLKRCPIGEKPTVQWEDSENSDANLNNVSINLHGFNNSIGPLYSSSDKVFSSPAGPSSDQRNE